MNLEEKDVCFMDLAKVVSLKSDDPNTKVGAIIVDEDDTVLSTGYNKAPDGFEDEMIWERTGKPLETKYIYVCHAELNAICNCQKLKKDLKGKRIYVTLFPCNECAKLIIQSGIKEVIYESDKYANTDSTIASKHMLDTCGVTYRQVNLVEKEDNKEKVKTNLPV